MSSADRAVVIVSGGAAISPFTTPDAVCRTRLPAGNTGTFLREGLLAAGHDVFTSPATIGPGTADADLDWQGFADPPEILPAAVTVDSVASIDAAGASLATFLGLLAERYGYRRFDIVGHSMGGLFGRAAIRVLREEASPLSIGSLVTIGTPWTGSFPADHVAGDLTLAETGGDPRIDAIITGFASEVALMPRGGAVDQVTQRYLAGPDGWNARQQGVLDDIPVTAIGGDAFRPASGAGSPRVWPNDGLITLDSALAAEVPPATLPRRTTHTFPDAHSSFVAEQLGLPWHRALTWDADVLAVVASALA